MKTESKTEEQPRKPKVLFIEDDPQQMDIFKIYCERNGIEIERSYDGPDGISVAENWQPDFIILDIRMEEMDRVAVMSVLQIRDKTKDIPVIAYTNYDPTVIYQEMMDMGTIAVWEKTLVRPPELVEHIKKMYQIKESHALTGESFYKLRDKLRAAVS